MFVRLMQKNVTYQQQIMLLHLSSGPAGILGLLYSSSAAIASVGGDIATIPAADITFADASDSHRLRVFIVSLDCCVLLAEKASHNII